MSAAQALDIYKAIDFQLRIESGPDAGRAFRIYPPEITIGRDPKCDVTLKDPKTSRVQCKIVFGNSIVLTDMSSRGTSLVNGRKFSTHNIVPNDVIAFGETRIKFVAQSKTNLPAVKGSQAAASQRTAPSRQPLQRGLPRPGMSAPPKKNYMPMILIVLLLVAGVGFLLTSTGGSAAKQDLLTTSEELARQAEESREFQEKLETSYKDKLKTSRAAYQVAVQQHYIRGFRDFQAGNYGRAIQAFNSALAKDPNHTRARRYLQLSIQRREEKIEKHMLQGEKFKEKLMYDRCMSEFEKVLVLLNRPQNPKYILSKERLNECTILQSGGAF